MIDVHEFLWISVNNRKPGALDLNHNSVPFEECVAFVAEIEFDMGHLTRHKRLGVFKTVPVFPSEDIVIVLRADTYNGKNIRNLNRVVERIIEAGKVKPKRNPVFVPLGLNTPKKYRPLEGSKIKPETYTGTYQWDGKHTWNGDAVTIRQEKSQLILDHYHYTMRFRLLPISKKRFFVEDIERILDVRMGADGKPSAVMLHHTETTAGLYYTIMAKGIDAAIEEF